MRKETLISQIKQLLEHASGIELEGIANQANFIEIGLDSLLLTQIAQNLKKEFQLPITFRKLSEEYYNLDLLAEYLDKNLPATATDSQSTSRPTAPLEQPVYQMAATPPMTNDSFELPQANDAISLISQQISLLSQQVALLQGVQPSPVASLPPSRQVNGAPRLNNSRHVNGAQHEEVSPQETIELKKPFGATARIERQSSQLNTKQQQYLKNFIEGYTQKTRGSKTYTQTHRKYMADPRVVSGFKPTTKEMVYSIVANRSKGCRIWDLDGNEYIDCVNGFGSSMLGYQPDTVKKALLEQIEAGYEVGPQHEKAGEVCKLVCEFTKFDRAGLCNTGSEAVLGAMRIARTVTGRSIIVSFTDSYHGIVDEVIVRGTKKLRSFPAASGIMPEAVQNMLVLEYGTEESLRIIRERAHELAAVLVEPIQSRRPEFVPVDFLKEVRRITEQSGAALIFDEVISGFRFHQRGAQGLFDIQADIAAYGKVAGAGISIGIIAGKERFMDSLDGGYWSYGDDSMPEVGVTYFAGTFVRHPLALSTTLASLTFMKAQGPQLQENLNNKTEYLADRLNNICKEYGTPIFIARFGSLWKIKYEQEYPYNELLFALMRFRNIHILDGFPCYMTTCHTDEDIERIITAFEESIEELTSVGLIPSSLAAEEIINKREARATHYCKNQPPVPDARLGKDRQGNPAWFVEDKNNPGKYLQVAI